jgi:hypothetical protein
MRRNAVEPGEEYVTSYGAHVRVIDQQPGWLLKNGQWERDERVGVRLKPGKDGEPYQTYQLNSNIRCIVINERGDEKPGVVRPQLLVRKWEEHLRLEKARAKTDRASQRAGRQAVRALKVRGATLDIQHGTITVPIDEITRVAGMGV